MIEAKFHARTFFCLDVHHAGRHAHFDGVSPGDRVQCGGSTFVIGTRVRLVPVRPKWGGMVPSSTKLAESEGDTELAELMGTLERRMFEDPPARGDQPLSYWAWLDGLTERGATFARCQWKGTDADFSFTCTCGAHLRVRRDFAYAVACPFCCEVFATLDDAELAPAPATGFAHVDTDECES